MHNPAARNQNQIRLWLITGDHALKEKHRDIMSVILISVVEGVLCCKQEQQQQQQK